MALWTALWRIEMMQHQNDVTKEKANDSIIRFFNKIVER